MRALTFVASVPLIGLTSAAAGGTLSFDIETIVADNMFNNRPTTAVDSNGVVHTAFMTQFDTDDSSKEIIYANNAGGSWNFTPITDNNVREEFPDLALDDDGNVHITVHTGTGNGNKIRYVNDIGGSFGPIIDITGEGYVIPELAIDSQGTVHFTFRTQTLSTGIEEVYYTTWTSDGGVGPLENISATPVSDSRASQIAVGPDDDVHIVYQEGNPFGGDLIYVNNASGVFQEVTTGVTQAMVDPIVLVSDEDVVNILYRADDFMWAVDDGGTGSFSSPLQVHDEDALPAFYADFALDAQGRRHLAFASNVGELQGIIYIAENEDGFAEPQTLVDTDATNLGTSIGVNDNGGIAVTYSLSGFDSKEDVVFADLFAATTTIGDACPADIDGDDGVVNVNDLLTLLANWGTGGAGADLASPSDVVNVADLLELLAQWGPCD